MRALQKLITISLILLMGTVPWVIPVHARQMSKAGSIFNQVQHGVVTVFTAGGHGSGALIDTFDHNGLILTNSHVVRENTGHLRVKFGPGQILQAHVIQNSREDDLAIIWVNLKNLQAEQDITPLPFFTPPAGEPVVLVGEQVIAVGSPLERDILEKTLTTGVVGKFDGSTIHHDASINPGNSGGPLLNYDGQIVGINTFINATEKGAGVGGAVPVSKAIRLLTAARATLTQASQPSADLLPDVPTIAYPISQFLREKPDMFGKNRRQQNYNFSSRFFDVSILTPPQTYHQVKKSEDKVLKRRKKRGKKKGFEVTDDEYEYKNLAYYNYQKPVVQVLVSPKPKLTTGSKVANTITFLAAGAATVASLGAGAPLLFMPFFMGQKEIKKDFLKMDLQTASGKLACTPIESGRVPFKEAISELTSRHYISFQDKSYVGLYTFDAHCFENPEKLKLVIDIEGQSDADRTIKVPTKTQNLVVKDFKPYWQYVDEQKVQGIVVSKDQKLPPLLTKPLETNTLSTTPASQPTLSSDPINALSIEATTNTPQPDIPDYLEKYYADPPSKNTKTEPVLQQ
ncbi:MAG: trypsin-like peptidase domain-containing protein [Vampirovibrio sp.]|nr:trypsin-like peptidase domain-containing protein [Vampirovibrio sp.]